MKSHVVQDGRTRLMGILNLTPDSFSDGGRFTEVETAVQHGLALLAAGAEVLDLGGESTRPGHDPVDAGEQCRRVIPTLTALRERTDAVISVDTTLRAVAEAALDAGADWINDTTAFRGDPSLADLCAERGCPVVLMIRTEPAREEGSEPSGRALITALRDRMRVAADGAERRGIDRDRIVLDPGVGFGLAARDNVDVHAFVDDLRSLGYPLLVGASRKRFLGHLTGRPTEERVYATAASTAALALCGVEFLRVHDVAPMRDVVAVCQAIRERRVEEVAS
ncbi:MAG: dihydropteroate synthase [Planctomycetota bacterium]